MSKPTNQRVREGDEVTLNCTASGYPTPVIRWIRNGQTKKTGETLSFIARRDDSGKYWCKVDNGLGPAIVAEALLDVQCKNERLCTTPHSLTSRTQSTDFNFWIVNYLLLKDFGIFSEVRMGTKLEGKTAKKWTVRIEQCSCGVVRFTGPALFVLCGSTICV